MLKEGVGEDFANKDKIAGLLRFASALADTADETVSLADYIGRMKEGQDKIYYVTAEPSTPPRTARISRSSARRASRCCCCPTASMSGWSATSGVRRQAAGLGRQGRPRPGQAGGRNREKGRCREGNRRAQGPARQDEGSLGDKVKEVASPTA